MEHIPSSGGGAVDGMPVVEEQSRALLQAVPDLVFLLGLDGRYIDIFSARDEDLFRPREELIGRTVCDVLPSPVGDDCMAAIAGLATPYDVTSFEYELLIDDKPRSFEGRVTYCGARSVIVLVRDFTEQRLAEQAVQKAHGDLKRRADQLQRLSLELTLVEQRERQRMACVLHDNLQQLLVGVKFNVAILAKNVAGAEGIEAARRVNDVLDLAIRQSQDLTVDLYPPILYEGTLGQALQWVGTYMLQTHGLDVTLDVEASAPVEMADDIRVVLFNAVRELLFNVVKHAGVESATVRMSSPTDDKVCVTVSDEGRGAKSGEMGGEESNTGSGFGLFAIGERIESLGGTVAVDCEPGRGCRVALTVPIQAALDVPDYVRRAGDRRSLRDGLQVEFDVPEGRGDSAALTEVFLVDDHAVMRQGLSQLLRLDPSLVVVGEASDGEMAVELVRRTAPDVVLMDISMPGMSGVEATRLICAEHPGIRVIGLSMYDESQRAAEILNAGACGYVSKADAAENVLAMIHASLGK